MVDRATAKGGGHPRRPGRGTASHGAMRCHPCGRPAPRTLLRAVPAILTPFPAQSPMSPIPHGAEQSRLPNQDHQLIHSSPLVNSSVIIDGPVQLSGRQSESYLPPLLSSLSHLFSLGEPAWDSGRVKSTSSVLSTHTRRINGEPTRRSLWIECYWNAR